jgi:DNA (cytosine-5)-methyltransferase 1
MKHGSLFSGIGGFDLAAEWMGWDNIFHCEWMPFPRKVLNHYWPNSISYEDITKTDFSIHRGTIDILTGGFPCQPYSHAGKRLGKADERHLWPHMLRAIQEIEPTYIVGENVRGITNWSEGLVFEEVCLDLENQGYEVQPVLLAAAGVGAPHKRERIWFVAQNTKRNGLLQREPEQEGTEVREQRNTGSRGSVGIHLPKGDASNTDSIRQHQRIGEYEEHTDIRRFNALNDTNENVRQGNTANTNSNGLEGRIPSDINRQKQGEGEYDEKRLSVYGHGIQFERFPTQSPICSGDDGIPTQLDGITFSKWRQESIKGYGNAIVPQVALEIFKTIEQLHG